MYYYCFGIYKIKGLTLFAWTNLDTQLICWNHLWILNTVGVGVRISTRFEPGLMLGTALAVGWS